jgi:hypothetical protein
MTLTALDAAERPESVSSVGAVLLTSTATSLVAGLGAPIGAQPMSLILK